jgi:hypothetical protein
LHKDKAERNSHKGFFITTEHWLQRLLCIMHPPIFLMEPLPIFLPKIPTLFKPLILDEKINWNYRTLRIWFHISVKKRIFNRIRSKKFAWMTIPQREQIQQL